MTHDTSERMLRCGTSISRCPRTSVCRQQNSYKTQHITETFKVVVKTFHSGVHVYSHMCSIKNH
uniref:Uncharacterized protein n=1 Tax=Strigamia maritima TaxID=126957 RepID=T1JJN3_STRMM